MSGEYRPEGFEDTDNPLPRDMPDQQAGGGDDKLEIDVDDAAKEPDSPAQREQREKVPDSDDTEPTEGPEPGEPSG
ncbi:hypothetical protein [Streptomyces zhihengii]|uniref:Preprotein translocase YidC n=1 Tax=Streptomyces zhihengii TaxID=1818004 RepID=A0ABS2V0Q1_9ACTN|nr:hypothetical protein [Streptomyces zhihengii]MBM9623305.1 hypothetical protein [Streptomyces zhihengii]